ncbi:hypothetical protein [Thalassotalea agariperforans]
MTILGFKIWKVTDESMAPSIPVGSYILVNHWFHLLTLNVNSVVLIHHHFYGYILKKVTVIDKYGFIWSRAENDAYDALTSVEKVGPVNKKQVIGKVFMIFKRPMKTNIA